MRAAILFALQILLLAVFSSAQTPEPQELGLRPPQFLAISVADLDAAARWYSQTFAMTNAKDLPSVDAGVRTRILSSPELVIELSQHAKAKSLREYAGSPTPTFLVHGYFKAGLFVQNLDRAIEVLRARGVTSIGAPQSDDALGLRWVLFRDNGGNFLQLLERRSIGR